MGSRWQKKRKKEHYYKKAKKEGYRSRAAYKLKQLNERYNLIHSGDTIVDLGAAPGGWLQVARELTGEKGVVLGVDLDEIEEIPAKNIKTIQGDITEEEIIENIQNELLDSPDVILSDVSPNISGIWDVDQARSVDLSILLP
ncbi:MAG: RlmE family RNA methyltransferase, partial [Hadesarchaea archaeon]|nr:RlmE family RNA methyltransferase [Hadesarchaea archaeon]